MRGHCGSSQELVFENIYEVTLKEVLARYIINSVLWLRDHIR